MRDWVKKLRDFDLLTHYKKRQLCESALQSLGYDPKRIPCTADPGYGHSQLDTSGEADAQDYDAQISALVEGRLPPSLGPSSSGATSSGLRWWFRIPKQCSDTNHKSNAKVFFYFYDPSMPDFSRGTGHDDQEDSGRHEELYSDDSYTFQ